MKYRVESNGLSNGRRILRSPKGLRHGNNGHP